MPTCTGTSTTSNTTCTGRYYDVGMSTVRSCTSSSNYGCNNNMPGCVRRNQVTACNATINHVPNAGQPPVRGRLERHQQRERHRALRQPKHDNNVGRANDYDMVIFDCEGEYVDFSGRRDTRIREYVANGGRGMFASHFAYTWIGSNGTSMTPQNGDTVARRTLARGGCRSCRRRVNERAGATLSRAWCSVIGSTRSGALTWTGTSRGSPSISRVTARVSP
ncbi:MAG: hypothetical protein IPG81_10195 [Sandaracinaceae bacterium]|nr:hypothetical protein [Sandaracinaceae bacterium]